MGWKSSSRVSDSPSATVLARRARRVALPEAGVERGVALSGERAAHLERPVDHEQCLLRERGGGP